MKKTTVCLCALGALCLLTAALPAGFASAQEMAAMAAAMGGSSTGASTSESTTVSATSVTGGSGRGSSEESRTVSHARSTVTSTLGYDALELTVESVPAATLTVGGVSLELTYSAADGAALNFTPAFIAWPEAAQAETDQEAEPDEAKTALLLTATDDAAGSWAFRGTVLRKLKSSGVRWLVLRAGEQTLAFPTEGFLGGYCYDQWRSAGIASKDIQYTVSAGSDPPKLLAAANGESRQASADAGDMLYYAGVTSQGAGVNGIE